MEVVHAEVMTRGWSDRAGDFVQRYGAETLHASALRVPLMGLLPADYPRSDYPQVWSQAEYVRAVLAGAQARG